MLKGSRWPTKARSATEIQKKATRPFAYHVIEITFYSGTRNTSFVIYDSDLYAIAYFLLPAVRNTMLVENIHNARVVRMFRTGCDCRVYLFIYYYFLFAL